MKSYTHGDIFHYLKKRKIKFIVHGQNFWISSEVKPKQLKKLIEMCDGVGYKMRFTEIQLHIYANTKKNNYGKLAKH